MIDWIALLTRFAEGFNPTLERAATAMNSVKGGLPTDVACPDCGKKIYLFGEGKTAQAAAAHNLPLLAEMPIDPALASLTDAGSIEDFQGDWLKTVADRLAEK